MYSSETFGDFKVQKTLKISNLLSPKRKRLKNGEIACIVIFGFIFIVIICIILFFTVFRRKEHSSTDDAKPMPSVI